MTARLSIYNPETLGKPLGQYTHVTRVRADEFLFVAGMLSADAQGHVVGAQDFDAQCRQVFANVHAALQSAGASWKNVFPDGVYPPNTLLIVDRLVQEPFLVEVQTIAAV